MAFSTYSKNISNPNGVDYKDIDYFVWRLLLDMAESEPDTSDSGDLLKNYTKIIHHKDRNLSDLKNTEGTNMLLTFSPDLLNPENVDYSLNYQTSPAIFHRAYKIYLTMFASKTAKDLLMQTTKTVIDNLTRNWGAGSSVVVPVPGGSTYSSYLLLNQASEPDITTEFQSSTEAGYITADFTIIFKINKES